MTDRLLEELALQARPALQHAELVHLVLTWGGSRIQRRVREAGYGREEAKAARALATIRSRYGDGKVRELAEEAGLDFRAMAFKQLATEMLRTTRGEGTARFLKLIERVGAESATAFLLELVTQGEGWFYHSIGTSGGAEDGPVMLVVRPSPANHPGASDIMLNFDLVRATADWTEEEAQHIARLVFRKIIAEEHARASERLYWRLRASMQVVRALFPHDDPDGNVIERHAILTMVVLGRLLDIRPYALYEPLEHAKDGESELRPVLARLAGLGYNTQCFPEDIQRALEAPDFSPDSMLDTVIPYLLKTAN